MTRQEKEKLIKFSNDSVMKEAVYSILLDSFLKISSSDVNTLAAQMLATDLLKKAWREVDKYKDAEEEVSNTPKQIGM